MNSRKELLERITKLENLVQELEKKLKEVSDTCSDMEHKRFIRSEGNVRSLGDSLSEIMSVEMGEPLMMMKQDYFCSNCGEWSNDHLNDCGKIKDCKIL